ncbi:hypothetical protein [Sphingobacterium deserti]|uniref:Uncharacterized protein n=1 Tax=Sphingobacterium deserti TaxID=1229276 RepID=A0A0B8T0S8_9SPHI|nr:hypothetical protein [Sphingobacterium deserti]KGE14327.1 hypothetical protein DI53_1941 [Sphingobacterium deserti]
MKEIVQLSLAGSDGSQHWYSAQIDQNENSISVTVTGYKGFKEIFQIAKDGNSYKVSPPNISSMKSGETELYKKLQIIGSRYL